MYAHLVHMQNTTKLSNGYSFKFFILSNGTMNIMNVYSLFVQLSPSFTKINAIFTHSLQSSQCNRSEQFLHKFSRKKNKTAKFAESRSNEEKNRCEIKCSDSIERNIPIVFLRKQENGEAIIVSSITKQIQIFCIHSTQSTHTPDTFPYHNPYMLSFFLPFVLILPLFSLCFIRQKSISQYFFQLLKLMLLLWPSPFYQITILQRRSAIEKTAHFSTELMATTAFFSLFF